MAISVGSVEVDVVPNTRGVYQQLRSQLTPAAARAGRDAGQTAGRSFSTAMRSEVGQIGLQLGQQIGSQIAARITAEIRGALRDGVTQGGRTARPAATRQGEQAGGAFARSARARIEAAFRSLPDITVGADTSEADSDLQALRARMETLAGKRIGVDIDTAEARAEVTDLEEQLRRLGAAHPNPTVRADTAAARAQLAELRTELDRISADRTTIRLETDGTFGQRLRTAVQQAEASLPNINIGADTTPAQAEIASLRAQLTALRDVRVGVDIDAATAQARIADLQGRLERLSASNADVAVRVDASAAAAQLATVQAMVNRLDGQTARVHVDTSGAVSALLQLSIAVAGVAAIPAIPVVAAGIGAIGAAATAAGVGVGALALVAAPAIKGITEALQAQKAAEDAAASSAARGSQVAAQAARQALTRASAQQALVTAERNGARQIAQAEQQVRQAKQAAADAAAQAAQRQQAATRAVQDAERSLATAQRDARQAQEDLTAARRQAARDLEDLNARLAGAELSQRDAVLGVREAQMALSRTMADAKATELDRARAQLAYDQAVQRLKDQTTETRRLKSETAAANKAGVAGSDTVRSAQQRLAQAQQQVADRARAVRDAQAEAARVQTQTAREVAAAQARVGEATRNVAVAQQSAADAVAAAQRQIRSAELSAAGGADQAAMAQAKYKQALADMTPAARGTFTAFQQLRTAFQSWSRALQPTVMPIFTRALNGLKNSLPGLTPLVQGAARGIKTLQDRASAGFKTPWWKSFKADLSGSVEPAITGLGVSFGRVFKGMAGVVDAFLPHMDSISRRMQNITGKFANWGTGLKGSPEFERFLAYASRMGPQLGETLGDIGSAFWQIGRALEPLSGPLLKVLGGLADAIAVIAEKAPWMIQLVYGIIVALKLWTLAQAALNFVMSQNPLVRIALLVGLLVAAVIYAYNRFGWFRTAVQAAWAGIKTAALWAWNTVLKPVFNAVKVAIQAVATVARWLWHNVFGPVFRGIAAVVMWWWNNVVKRYFGLVRGAFRLVASVARWLWHNVLAPVFRGIGKVISWWWNNIVKRYFGFVRSAVGKVADVFRWLRDKIVKPVWAGIREAIKVSWEKGIRPAFNAVRSAVRKVAEAFEKAKDALGKSWAKIKSLTRKPIKWVIDIVYNKGVRGLWNTAAKVLPIKKLPVFKFAKGGAVHGPGTATSDSIPARLSRGEHVWTAKEVQGAGGHRAVEGLRAAARGAAGRSGPTPAAGGVPGFALGGAVDWFKGAGDKLVGGARAVAGGVSKGLSKLKDATLGAVHKAASAAATPIRALINKIPGGTKGWGSLAKAVPTGLLNEALAAIKGSEEKELAAGGGPGVARALKWAKSQAGKPYQWGGAGNPSWDCSGFMSGIQKVIQGKNPKGRLWSTFSFQGKRAPAGWEYHKRSPFQIGITNKGKGHTAGTLGGTNVESRGGDGVVVGRRARGYNSPMFGKNWYGFKPAIGGGVSGKGVAAAQATARQMLGEYGWSQKQWPPLQKLWQRESGWRWNARNPSSGAYGIPQALPASKMRSAGADWRTNPATQIKWGMGYIKNRRDYGSPARAWAKWQARRPHWYDNGGLLQPGLNLVANGTGRPEPVLTGRQWDALTGAATRGADQPSLGDLQVQVYVGDREITDITRAEIRKSNGELLTALGARAGR
ncbi:aggregation-promoting factor C-terminal-like domain-containing protein [Streptomyces albus]|uniref:aggregation-promoting factor C-terminal-like domain-containing protein n=1 Tax=Streptomyces albus TaxID=1888 RepID=UPI003879B770